MRCGPNYTTSKRSDRKQSAPKALAEHLKTVAERIRAD